MTTQRHYNCKEALVLRVGKSLKGGTRNTNARGWLITGDGLSSGLGARDTAAHRESGTPSASAIHKLGIWISSWVGHQQRISTCTTSNSDLIGSRTLRRRKPSVSGSIAHCYCIPAPKSFSLQQYFADDK